MVSSIGSDREKKKKEKEKYQSKSLFPIIQEYLGLKDFDIRETEKPDFIFYHGSENLLGLEVIICLPQCSNGITNVKEQDAYQKKFCYDFKNRRFLKDFTKDEKLNIRIYPYKRLCKSNKDAFEKELELHLKSWRKGINLGSTRHIRKLSVRPTLGDNVVYFHEGGRMDPCRWDDLSKCITKKEDKLKSYKAQNRCKEYWLCIYLPCITHKSLNLPIDFGGKMHEAVKSIRKSDYTRIYVTQDYPVDLLASAIEPAN